MRISAILIVTGASGSGKTTTVRGLEARALPGVRCYYFDTVGVPAAEALEREFGSPESWQAVTTRAWLDRLAADPDSADVYVLDRQTRPSFVRSVEPGRSSLLFGGGPLCPEALDMHNERIDRSVYSAICRINDRQLERVRVTSSHRVYPPETGRSLLPG